MSARRCSTCGISYPTTMQQCLVCAENTDFISNEEPHEDWQAEVERANHSRMDAGVFRTTDDKVTRWRRDEFMRLGLDKARADHFAPLRDGLTQGWMIDLGRFRELVAIGCKPELAIDILV